MTLNVLAEDKLEPKIQCPADVKASNLIDWHFYEWKTGSNFWLVTLNSGDKTKCHGVAISKNTVITTGRCATEIKGDKTEDKRISCGLLEHTGDKENEKKISKFVIHPEYDDATAKNNLALVVIDGAFELDEKNTIKIVKPTDVSEKETEYEIPVLTISPKRMKTLAESKDFSSYKAVYRPEPTPLCIPFCFPMLWGRRRRSVIAKREIKIEHGLAGGFKINVSKTDCDKYKGADDKNESSMCSDYCCHFQKTAKELREGRKNFFIIFKVG